MEFMPHRSVVLVLACLAVSLQVFANAEPGRVHALLINGGQSANSNALSHLHHLQDMVEALKRRGIPLDGA